MGEIKRIEARDNDRNVHYIPDVVYATKDGVDLKLQVLQPVSYEYDRNPSKLPCVLFVQGSAWLEQNIYFNIPQIAAFAKRGYVAGIVQYRHSGIAPFPAQIMDVKTAVRYMRIHAEEYGIDSDNIFLWGDSSGAHSAMGAAFSAARDILEDDVYREVSAQVNAVVNFNAPVDLYEMREAEEKWAAAFGFTASPGSQFIGGASICENRELADRTNTARLISGDFEIPPVLIIHGDQDSIVPYSQSEILKAALDRNQKVYEMYALIGSEHSGPSFFCDEVYDIMEDFLCRNLK